MGENGTGSTRFTVSRTSDRGFAKEYIAQLNERTLEDRFPDTAEDEFLLVRSESGLETELHTRVQVNDVIRDGHVGLDFTLRTALGAPSELDLRYGEADSVTEVVVERIDNAEEKRWRRGLNRALGVRPQVCRVRMGVFPDLEDKVCRLPKNTMELIGIENGDNVTIESTRGIRIVRGVKAYEIDEEREATKATQKERDSDRYPSCEDLLRLDRVRRTEVDIPELWIDEEVRETLGLQELPNSGICQPVRVYRDTGYLLLQTLHRFSIPLVLVLIGAGLEIQNSRLAAILWGGAVVLWIVVLLVESHSRLS